MHRIKRQLGYIKQDFLAFLEKYSALFLGEQAYEPIPIKVRSNRNTKQDRTH